MNASIEGDDTGLFDILTFRATRGGRGVYIQWLEHQQCYCGYHSRHFLSLNGANSDIALNNFFFVSHDLRNGWGKTNAACSCDEGDDAFLHQEKCYSTRYIFLFILSVLVQCLSAVGINNNEYRVE